MKDRVRVYELARQMDISNDDIITTLRELGYDIKSDQPTGKYDSTGIFRTWYGRWHDRARDIGSAAR